MTGKVHAILGTSTAVAIAVCVQEIEIFGATIYPVASVITAVAGSYLPDIDIQQSKLGHKVKWLSKHMKHRGITHTLLFPIILFGLMLLLAFLPGASSLIFGLLVGYLAHIFADLFNKTGVPLLWPFTKYMFHFASIKTASKWQQVIFIILWEVVLVGWIMWYYGLLQKVMGLS